MTLYAENPKDTAKQKQKQKKLVELINKFIKFARHKINIQKSVVSLYLKSDLSEKETKGEKSHL